MVISLDFEKEQQHFDKKILLYQYIAIFLYLFVAILLAKIAPLDKSLKTSMKEKIFFPYS